MLWAIVCLCVLIRPLSVQETNQLIAIGISYFLIKDFFKVL